MIRNEPQAITRLRVKLETRRRMKRATVFGNTALSFTAALSFCVFQHQPHRLITVLAITALGVVLCNFVDRTRYPIDAVTFSDLPPHDYRAIPLLLEAYQRRWVKDVEAWKRMLGSLLSEQEFSFLNWTSHDTKIIHRYLCNPRNPYVTDLQRLLADSLTGKLGG